MGLGVVSWRGERAGQVCYLRRGATGPADVRTARLCGRPHASRGAALLELGGPLRGRGEGRGADCPWHSDPFRVRARYGVGWGCAERLRGFFCQEKTKECREKLIKAHARPKTNTT